MLRNEYHVVSIQEMKDFARHLSCEIAQMELCVQITRSRIHRFARQPHWYRLCSTIEERERSEQKLSHTLVMGQGALRGMHRQGRFPHALGKGQDVLSPSIAPSTNGTTTGFAALTPLQRLIRCSGLQTWSHN